MSDIKEKLKELKKSADKQFGEGSVLLFDDKSTPKVEVISTGIYSLDKATGIGGLPRGRIIELYGVPSGGKSSIALYTVAETQKSGGICAYLDIEHSMDLALAKAYGVKVDELLFSQPNGGEECLSLLEHFARSGEVSLIVVDSVAALVPMAELEGEMGASNIGLQARLMSKAMRVLNGVLSKTKSTAVFINQLRANIGGYGQPEVSSGGVALKYYSSLRLEVRAGEKLKDGEKIVGHSVKVKVVKNKLAAPFTTAEFNLVYGVGIDRFSDIVDLAIKQQIIEQTGAWFIYNGEKFHGKDAIKDKLQSDKPLLKSIMSELK